MKKVLGIFLAMVMILCMAGCGQSSSSGSQTNTSDNNSANSGRDCSYTIDGVQLVPGEIWGPSLEKLGEPDNYSEAASCYYDGLDKIFTYDGFEIRTYPDKEKDRILDICISSDKYKTDEGLAVGDTLEDINRVYGDRYILSGNSTYRYYLNKEAYVYFFVLNEQIKYWGLSFDSNN